ncbi:MAG: chlorite dismutase family protein [Gemmatimonadota bacterium]
MTDENASQFVQYLMLRVDPQWRRLDPAVREAGRAELAQSVRAAGSTVESHAYSTLGLKAGVDILLWWRAAAPDVAQELVAAVLSTSMGRYCEVAHSLWGITRPSVYTKRRTAQDDALGATNRLKYLIVYPFVKTSDWYLLSRDARQEMMNDHMRVGHAYDDVRQVLVYTTGLDDQEFIVAYETDRLERHHELVVALRATQARRYTQRDTPIFTAIHRTLDDVLALAG